LDFGASVVLQAGQHRIGYHDKRNRQRYSLHSWIL